MTLRYLVPWFDLTWDDLEGAMAELGAVPTEPEQGVLAAWQRGGTGIHFFEEGVRQLAVDGAEADQLADMLGQRIHMYTPSDMPRVFDDPIYSWHVRLAILAAVAPPVAEPALVALFRRGFEHADTYVRAVAVMSAAIPRWPELRADIERLAGSDPEERVRRPASLVLVELDRARVRDP